MVLLHLRVALIQLDQQVIAAPVAIAQAVVVLVVAPKVHIAEPIPITGLLPVLQQILKSKEAPAHMVEYAIHDNFLAAGVTVVHKIPKFRIGAQAAVHQAIVHGVIPVGPALKQRANIDGRTPQGCRMSRPFIQLPESPWRGLAVILMGTTAQAQRVNVIKYRVIIPSHWNLVSLF